MHEVIKLKNSYSVAREQRGSLCELHASVRGLSHMNSKSYE